MSATTEETERRTIAVDVRCWEATRKRDSDLDRTVKRLGVCVGYEERAMVVLRMIV
jgi:hypothetical protein